MNRVTLNLFSLFQKLDYRDRESSAKKKIFGILVAYLFANTILSYNYFISFDEHSFIILAFTSNLFLLALIILTDFDNLFLASRSMEVLITLPVSSSAVFKAKFLSAIIFLLFFMLSSSLPQIIFFYFFSGDLLRTVFFLVSNLLFCYFSSGILILIYVFALKYFKAKASLVLNLLQILFFVFIFYSSTLASKAVSVPKELFIRASILEYGPVKFLPQTLFSSAVYNLPDFLICLMLSASVFGLVYFLISKNYYTLSGKIKVLKSNRSLLKPGFNFPFIKSCIDNYILSDNYERASFYLVKEQLQNSKFLRVKYFPIAVMPLLFVIIGIISDLPHLLFFNKTTGIGAFFKTFIPVISPSVTFTLIMCSRLLVSNTKILDDSSLNTEWIYNSVPIKEKASILKGAAKFIYAAFILPVIIAMTVLLCFKADPGTVIINILFISAGIYLINSISMMFDKVYPFTLESTKFSSASKFIEVIFSMFLGLILFLIQIFVFQNIIFVMISIMIFIIVSILLNRN